MGNDNLHCHWRIYVFCRSETLLFLPFPEVSGTGMNLRDEGRDQTLPRRVVAKRIRNGRCLLTAPTTLQA